VRLQPILKGTTLTIDLYQLGIIYLIVGFIIAIVAARHGSSDGGWFVAIAVGLCWLPVAVFIAITGKKFDENN
jgi:hypothetical protein